MTNAGLATECGRVIGLGLEHVALVVKHAPSRKYANTIRLVRGRAKCPVGEIACVNHAGKTVAMFKAVDVLAWMVAQGMARIENGAIVVDGAP